MKTPDLSVIRDDVRATHAYPVADATGMVKLDAMENPYRLPAALAKQLGEHLAQVALNRYPPSNPRALKDKLARAIGLPAGFDLQLGNGSDELIHLIIQACAKPGACVLSPWPSFDMYTLSAQFDGVRFVGVPLRPDFALDRDATLAAIAAHQPAVTFIAWPNNPTGNLFDRDAVDSILDATPGLVVLDEAYLPFARDTWLPQLETRPNLLVLRTLSKLGLAGIRLGYLCGAPALLNEIDKVRPPYNINVLTQATADFLLDHLDVLDAQAAQIRRDRDEVQRQLRDVAGITVFRSAANFVLIRVRDANRVYAGLKQRGILVKDRSKSHPLLADCLRISIGTPDENAAMLQALRSTLKEVHP